MDATARWTDAELKRLERQINAEYTKTYKELKKEMSAVMVKISVDPNMTLEQKTAIMSKYDRLNKLSEQMADVIKDTNKTAQSFINKSAQNVYKRNYNSEAQRLGFSLLDNTAVRNILTGEVDPFTKLAIAGQTDKAAIMRKLQSELTTAILKGESIPNIAKRLKNVSENYLSNTIRIARTETTRVQNSARQAVGQEGQKLGLNMWKEWISVDDGRTRGTKPTDEFDHLSMNGVQVPLDEPFDVGGEKMMYPGDVSMGASAGNVINCRCTVINIIKEKDKK